MKYERYASKRFRLEGVEMKATAFHPTAFQHDVFAVTIYPTHKKFLLDKYTAFTQVKANSPQEAIEKAKEELDYDIRKIVNREKEEHRKLIKV